jgi:hypothetical protein
MDYRIGEFDKDEALAQLARDYLQAVGVAMTSTRAAECERKAQEYRDSDCPTYAVSFRREAEALRDAIENLKETKAA